MAVTLLYVGPIFKTIIFYYYYYYYFRLDIIILNQKSVDSWVVASPFYCIFQNPKELHIQTLGRPTCPVCIYIHIYIYIYINKHTTPFPFHNSGIYFSVSHFSQVAHFSPKKEKQALLSQLFSLPLEPALLLCLVPFLFLILIAFFHFFLYATYVSERVIFFELLC